MQGHTSASLPAETSKRNQPSKWKYSVSIFLTLNTENYWVVGTQKEKKILFIELIVFYWLLKGNTLLFFFSSEDGFFISSINGRKTIRGLLNDPVCCAVLVSNGFYFPWMPSISKCPSQMKSFGFPKGTFLFVQYFFHSSIISNYPCRQYSLKWCIVCAKIRMHFMFRLSKTFILVRLIL